MVLCADVGGGDPLRFASILTSYAPSRFPSSRLLHLDLKANIIQSSRCYPVVLAGTSQKSGFMVGNIFNMLFLAYTSLHLNCYDPSAGIVGLLNSSNLLYSIFGSSHGLILDRTGVLALRAASLTHQHGSHREGIGFGRATILPYCSLTHNFARNCCFQRHGGSHHYVCDLQITARALLLFTTDSRLRYWDKYCRSLYQALSHHFIGFGLSYSHPCWMGW